MKKQPSSVDDAKSALNILQQTQRSSLLSMGIPTWANTLLSVLFGIMVLSYASMRHENELAPLTLIGAVICFICLSLLMNYRANLLGVKHVTLPQNLNQALQLIGYITLTSALFIGTRFMAIEYSTVFAYLGAGLGVVCSFIIIRYYPTFLARGNR